MWMNKCSARTYRGLYCFSCPVVSRCPAVKSVDRHTPPTSGITIGRPFQLLRFVFAVNRGLMLNIFPFWSKPPLLKGLRYDILLEVFWYA
jgi:hypothetical protein